MKPTPGNTEFRQTVSAGLTIVDFWADWCGPCRMQGQVLTELEPKLPPGARVLKVNVDENPGLAAEFQVQAIPTLVLMKDGKQLQHWVGVQTAPALLDALRRAT